MTDREMGSPVNQAIVAAYERGDDVMVDPMDYVLLDNLVPVGTMFAGAYPDGPTSRDLSERLFEGKVPPNQIAPRLRILHMFGLCVHANRRGVNDKVWQITSEGRRVVERWKEKKGASA